ncbi:ROK family protein [Humibacter albus]|uniref:ROK family protein n=1 Tax=Humibacter albus TaxID=427754 RepID=UPI0003B3AD88|nr:ROK family protein [Humibacter albus]
MNVLLDRGQTLLHNAGDQSRLRRLNTLAVIEAIREQALTIPATAKVTGLSKTSTDSLIAQLVELGWVVAVDPLAPVGAGRPATRYRFRAEAAVVLGVDIGRHTVRAELADLNGEVFASADTPATEQDGPLDVLSSAVKLADRLLKKAKRERSSVWAIGVAIPAVVYNDVITRGPEGWSGVNVKEVLGAHFDCRIVVENDSNMAAFAEAWRGSASDVSDLVYIHSGNRTGSGLVINGSLFRGSNGAAGEIGAIHEVGWETAQKHLHAVVLENGTVVDRESVFEAASKGSASALAAVRRFSEDLAIGVAALVMTVDPEIVVVGGGNVRAGDVFLDPLRTRVEALCIARPAPPILPSTLRERASITGAVGYAATTVQELLHAAAASGTSLPQADIHPSRWPSAQG